MGLEFVVSDFDGTVTDVDAEAIPYVEGYKADVARDLGVSRSELDVIWVQGQRTIESNPSRYGWQSNGRIVAPAYADPLIMARTIVGLLLDDARLFMDEASRAELLDGYFRANYGNLDIVFKDKADAFLTDLSGCVDSCIVTNSSTAGVVSKLQHLSTKHSVIKVVGDAKKYELSSTYTDVPDSLRKHGFDRPLYLRREKYARVLHQLMEEHNILPKQVLVVGDIYELDLLLPQQLGMSIVLTPRPSTPRFEINWVNAYRNGFVARDLPEVLAFITGKTRG